MPASTAPAGGPEQSDAAPRRAGRLRRTAAGWARARGGGAAVEFALVTPMLLLLFSGILAYGIYLGAAHNLRQLAAEAARASVAGVTDAERAALAQDRVQRSLAQGGMFRASSLDVRVGSDPADADLYTVTLTLDATTLGIQGLGRLVPMPPDILRSTVSVRRGGL